MSTLLVQRTGEALCIFAVFSTIDPPNLNGLMRGIEAKNGPRTGSDHGKNGSNRTLVITGAWSGFGRGVAERFGVWWSNESA